MHIAILFAVIFIVAQWFWNTITSTSWLMWTLIGITALIGLFFIWALNERRKWAKSPEGKRATVLHGSVGEHTPPTPCP
jgi:hypothetical protein